MEDKKTTSSSELVFKIVFLCIFLFSLFIGVYLTQSVKNNSNYKDSKIEYIEHWTVIDERGRVSKVEGTYNDDRAYTQNFIIVSKLPKKVQNEDVLCFINRSDVKVYINGVLRKDFRRDKDTGIPGGSLKEFYVMVPLTMTDSGGIVEIIRGKTDWNPVVIPEVFVSSYDGVYDYIMKKHGIPFFMSVILFVESLFVTIMGIILRLWKKQTIDMLYAAWGIFIVACWLIAVSQITPFVTRVYFVDGVMGFLFCLMMPFSLLIYIDSIQKKRYQKLYRFLFVLSLISYILWTSLHFFGIFSFQKSLVYIDSELGVVVLCVIYTSFMDIKKGYVKEYLYTSIGFLFFMFTSIIQIVILIFFEKMINETPMLAGLMVLLILVSVQQVVDINKTREYLESEVRNKILESEQMLIHIVQTLTGTIDAKDTYTKGHSGRVANYSKEIARRAGYSESELNDIYMMGLLHDIGKIGIPDAVINKSDKLSPTEYKLIKTHPEMGAKILQNIKEKEELAICAKWHHERYDGKGYPDGIAGEEIPEKVRIITVADAYDAMTSYRSYRNPMSQDKVRSEIEKGKGTQFDPRFADIMLEMIAEDTDYNLKEKKE